MSDVNDLKAELLVLKKENADLRKEFDKMDKWHSSELIAEMKENAKLRELAWRLLEVDRIGATSNEWREIRELARELGVDV